MKLVLMPVQGASADDEGITVAHDKATVKDSPDIDGDVLSPEAETEL